MFYPPRLEKTMRLDVRNPTLNLTHSKLGMSCLAPSCNPAC